MSKPSDSFTAPGDTGEESDRSTAKGRFTRMFDREFISDAFERKAQAARDEAELAGAERDRRTDERSLLAAKIAERFSRRIPHLTDKFPEMQASLTPEGLATRMVFPPGKGSEQPVALEFEVEISHRGSAFHVHSRMTFEGETGSDRVSFAERKLDLDRVDRFVERKILDFVRRYLGDA